MIYNKSSRHRTRDLFRLPLSKLQKLVTDVFFKLRKSQIIKKEIKCQQEHAFPQKCRRLLLYRFQTYKKPHALHRSRINNYYIIQRKKCNPGTTSKNKPSFHRVQINKSNSRLKAERRSSNTISNKRERRWRLSCLSISGQFSAVREQRLSLSSTKLLSEQCPLR